MINNADQQAGANDAMIALQEAQEEKTYLREEAEHAAEEKKEEVTARSRTNRNPRKGRAIKGAKGRKGSSDASNNAVGDWETVVPAHTGVNLATR